MNTCHYSIIHVVFDFNFSLSQAILFELIDIRKHLFLKFFSLRGILSIQDNIFKKSFCKLIEKKTVLVLINCRDSGTTHFFKVGLYWSNIHYSSQAFILQKLLNYHFVSPWFIRRSVFKFVAVNFGVRIENEELSMWKFIKHSIHVLRYNLSCTVYYFDFLLGRVEFQIIIFQLFFFCLYASLDIIEKVIKLCKDNRWEYSCIL